VAGAVAGAYYGIPDAVKEQALSHLTDEMKQVIVKFEEKLELRL
jgi:ADP-ribosylglycohydrolase